MPIDPKIADAILRQLDVALMATDPVPAIAKVRQSFLALVAMSAIDDAASKVEAEPIRFNPEDLSDAQPDWNAIVDGLTDLPRVRPLPKKPDGRKNNKPSPEHEAKRVENLRASFRAKHGYITVDVACPVCKAKPNEKCTGVKGNHDARRVLARKEAGLS